MSEPLWSVHIICNSREFPTTRGRSPLVKNTSTYGRHPVAPHRDLAVVRFFLLRLRWATLPRFVLVPPVLPLKHGVQLRPQNGDLGRCLPAVHLRALLFFVLFLPHTSLHLTQE